MTTEQRQAAILRHMNWLHIDGCLYDKFLKVIYSATDFLQWPSSEALAVIVDELTPDRQFSYICHLNKECHEEPCLINATFAQRLHALCLTLNLEEA